MVKFTFTTIKLELLVDAVVVADIYILPHQMKYTSTPLCVIHLVVKRM